MSSVEGSTNNQALSPSLSASPSKINARDSKYYYADGSTVFLVDNVLFKVRHASSEPE
jgi:hypothetical protein